MINGSNPSGLDPNVINNPATTFYAKYYSSLNGDFGSGTLTTTRSSNVSIVNNEAYFPKFWDSWTINLFCGRGMQYLRSPEQ